MKEGPVTLLRKCISFGRFKITTVLRKTYYLPPVYQICLLVSKRRLSKCGEDIDTAADIAAVTGHLRYDHDEIEISDFENPTGASYERNGVERRIGTYRGMGPFRHIRMVQSDESIIEAARIVAEQGPSNIFEIGTAEGGNLYLWSKFLDSAERIVCVDRDFQTSS